MKAFRALALLCALALPTLAMAQPPAPPVYVGPGGSYILPTPSYQLGYDSGTGLACIVGSTATCKLAISGSFSASPFAATGVTTKITSGSGASLNGALSAAGPSELIYNSGTFPVWVNFGSSGAITAAVGTSYYIPAGQSIPLAGGAATWLAAYGVGGASDVYVTPGTGSATGWGGGGGGGGASTIADGADITQGAKADAACTAYTSACTVEQRLAALEKSAEDTTTKQPVKLADGDDATLGITTDGACATDNGACSLRQAVARVAQRLTTLLAVFPATLDTNAGAVGASTLRVVPATGSTVGATLSAAVTGPTSTLTLPATTTAYASGQLMANSATAGSVVVPSFSIANTAGGAAIGRLRLSHNDATSTAWPAVKLQIDLWSAAPTFTNGDRGAFLVATGSAGHLGSFTCTTSPEYGDGGYAECAPVVGSYVIPKLASGATVYWTMQTAAAGGVTGASKVFTVYPELLN